ncbi:MAG TPA: DUF3108 domain-containing protein [Calditrichia bacterium]|nr:DUF3108 domain-containing protein [Calditrichia bacterium]
MVFFLGFLINFPGVAQTTETTENDSLVDGDSLAYERQYDAREVDPAERTDVIFPLERVVENRAFDVGEKLTFKVRYGFVKAGTAVMHVKEKVKINDTAEAYHIVTTAKSARFFDPFYKVRDQVESYVDTRSFFSWRYHKRLREGGYKFDLKVDYQQPYGYAEVEKIRYHSDEDKGIRSQNSFFIEIPEYVMDVLASFYYTRTQNLRVGEPVYMTNHDNKKIYNLEVVVEKKEIVEVEAGKFLCTKIEPRLKGDAIFQQKGRMWIWVTDDERKMPVQIQSKIKVGSIFIELTDYEGLNGPLAAKIRK